MAYGSQDKRWKTALCHAKTLNIVFTLSGTQTAVSEQGKKNTFPQTIGVNYIY